MVASYVTSYEMYVNVKMCCFQLCICLHSHMLQLGSKKGGVISPEQCILASGRGSYVPASSLRDYCDFKDVSFLM